MSLEVSKESKKRSFLPNLHSKQTPVTSDDHLANTSVVRKRLLAGIFRRPELLASLLHHPGGVHGDLGVLHNGGATACFLNLIGCLVPGNTWHV